MRRILVAAALAGSVATGLAAAPAAQAATTEAAASTSGWGKYFSSDGKAYTFGKSYQTHGKVYTHWYGVDKPGGKRGYVWFEYYKGGHWYKFSQGWDGKHSGSWGAKGIKKIYTYTCWGDSKFDNCGGKYRIY